MAIETTYTNARQNLAKLLDAAAQDHETVIIKRRGSDDVAMISADELRGLEETVHLLKSPANAKRLLGALERSLAGEGVVMTIDELRAFVGFDEE